MTTHILLTITAPDLADAILRRTRGLQSGPGVVVETSIGYLRRKLGPRGGALITTVRQVGYRLDG